MEGIGIRRRLSQHRRQSIRPVPSASLSAAMIIVRSRTRPAGNIRHCASSRSFWPIRRKSTGFAADRVRQGLGSSFDRVKSLGQQRRRMLSESRSDRSVRPFIRVRQKDVLASRDAMDKVAEIVLPLFATPPAIGPCCPFEHRDACNHAMKHSLEISPFQQFVIRTNCRKIMIVISVGEIAAEHDPFSFQGAEVTHHGAA